MRVNGVLPMPAGYDYMHHCATLTNKPWRGSLLPLGCEAAPVQTLRWLRKIATGLLYVRVNGVLPMPTGYDYMHHCATLANKPWRGSLLPLGCEAAPIHTLRWLRKSLRRVSGLLRRPAGASSLATGLLYVRVNGVLSMPAGYDYMHHCGTLATGLLCMRVNGVLPMLAGYDYMHHCGTLATGLLAGVQQPFDP